jgi:hypothetical protein
VAQRVVDVTLAKCRADALRAHLDETDPGWQDRLRAELTLLDPKWESFPLLVWDEENEAWVTIVLLARPEHLSPPAPSGRLRSFFRRWFRSG